MTVRPILLHFVISTRESDFRVFAHICLTAISERLGHRIDAWDVLGSPVIASDTGLHQAIQRLSENDLARGDMQTVKLQLPEGVEATIVRANKGGRILCELYINKSVNAETPDSDMIEFMRRCADICRALLGNFSTHWARFTTTGGGAEALPCPPLVEHNSHFIVTTHNAVQAHYDHPDAFWESGWDSIEEIAGQFLLLRGMNTIATPTYLETIIPQQWALARAAKPGHTEYYLPQVEECEFAAYKSGASKIDPVGYVIKEKTAEFSCVLNNGEHIPGWQIFDLWNLIEEGSLPEGNEVETVRIVFLDRWAAEQEKRPLLDIGCRVYYYADDGELQEITE